MKIITISREFGSGGRELGKRLADALGIPCYDQQIIEMIAKKKKLDKDYVAHISEKDIRILYPSTIGKYIIAPNYMNHPSVQIVTEQIIRKMKEIDKNRASYRALFTDSCWGSKESYHLCINTSGKEIKKLIPGVASYVNTWFDGE